jgi:hypothetical protein
VLTGDGGRFTRRFDVPIGNPTIVARFAGDDHLGGTEVFREALFDRAHVRLDVAIEGGSTIDLDRPEHRMRVWARTNVGGAGLTVTVTENGRELARGTTDENGTVSFVLKSAELGPPSVTRLVVHSAADSRRDEAQTEVPIVRFRSTMLTLESSAARLGPGDRVTLRGRLTTRVEGLARRAVGLWAGERHLSTALTDEEGAFAATMRRDELGTIDGNVEIVARFEADAPWWGSSVSRPVVLHLESAAEMPSWWMLVSMAVTAAIFALAGGRRKPSTLRQVSSPARKNAFELATRRRAIADAFDVRGVAIDAHDETPLVDAAVRAHRGKNVVAETVTDAQGRFRLVLPAGNYLFEVEARGYDVARQKLSVPHHGEWSPATVRLRSLRKLAWESLRPIAFRLMPSVDRWGIWTCRELESAGRRRAPHARALGPLVAVIERACYGADPPSAADLEWIRRTAAEVEQELREEIEDDGR